MSITKYIRNITLHISLKWHNFEMICSFRPKLKYGIILLLIITLFGGTSSDLIYLHNKWSYQNHITKLKSNPKYQQLHIEKKFVHHFAPVVLKAYHMNNYHVLPSITIAQAGLESNWGTSKLYTHDYNPYGIKGNYDGNYATYNTSEVKSSGQKINIQAKFRKYPNFITATRDYNRLLAQGFLGNEKSNNYKVDTALLVKNKYATDPNYATKLNQLIQKLHLTKYDKKVQTNY